MSVNPGYTRRKELKCTLAELSTYGSVILYDGEVLYVQQADGKYAVKIGDGVTNIATLPYVINYSEVAAQATAAGNSATTAGNKALDAEAYAKGTRNGEAVGSSDPAYHNSAKYWADQAESSAESAASAATAAAEAALEDKADVDGSYETLHAGTASKATLADNFDSKMTLVDKSAYLHRTAGGSLEIAGQSRLKKIIGGSLPIIQRAHSMNGEEWKAVNGSVSVTNLVASVTTTGSTSTRIEDRTIPFIVNHVYMCVATVKSAKATKIRFTNQLSTIGSFSISANTATNIVTIFKQQGNDSSYFRIYVNNDGDLSDGDIVEVSKVMVIELTYTFGTTVANRLATLETANAGSGIAKVKEILVKDYYPYNVTAFTHTKTTGKQNVGFNLFDIRKLADVTGWSKSGDYYTGSASNFYSAFGATSFVDIPKNYSGQIQIAFEGYMATAGTGCRFRFYYTDGTTSDTSNFSTSNSTLIATSTADKTVEKVCFQYSNQSNIYIKKLCIDCYWDGERTGEFEDYQEWNYPTEDIELKGILSLDAQDNWVADGDEYLPSGVVDENIDEVDLGDLYYAQDDDVWYTTGLPTSLTETNARSNKLLYGGFSHQVATLETNKWYWSNIGYFEVYVPGATSSSDVATALSGTKIILKKTTPTQSSATPYTEIQETDNWGTEKWIDTRDVPLPVFSEAEYLPDLKAKTEVAPESPDDDGYYVMHRDNGENSYTPLQTWLSANDYKKQADLPTKDAVGGVLRQVLAQKESLDFNDTGVIDLGDQIWTYNSTYSCFTSGVISGGKNSFKLMCSKYKTVRDYTVLEDKSVSYIFNNCVAIQDTTYGTDTTTFKAAMKGALLAFEKAST